MPSGPNGPQSLCQESAILLRQRPLQAVEPRKHLQGVLRQKLREPRAPRREDNLSLSQNQNRQAPHLNAERPQSQPRAAVAEALVAIHRGVAAMLM